ncbi:hypothetical protein [Leifsonia sp. Leaf264]|uniref:hypothetical protein n=1 Tax=Leifsonia sp. Leaf264 TaxID=1736314 RepID=UPI000701D67A|nr:hypothetical protein [Leifsonia sp. Leaf264]KQO98808.1 hypothetical protein ASF30_12155 [Leifsonia sp. Leaf264]
MHHLAIHTSFISDKFDSMSLPALAVVLAGMILLVVGSTIIEAQNSVSTVIPTVISFVGLFLVVLSEFI